MSAIILVVIITALVFDVTNGFHDTANTMATSIATGALTPRQVRSGAMIHWGALAAGGRRHLIVAR